MRKIPTVFGHQLPFAAAMLLGLGLLVAELPEARAETVQSCRRKGCRLNVNTYRCVCPRRRTVKRGKVRLRCPRGTRRNTFELKRSRNRRNWGKVFNCVKRRGKRKIAHGPMVALWPTGARRWEATFVNGKKHGAFKTYNRKGKLWRLEHYVAGNLRGKYKGWWPDIGKLRTEGQYSENRRVGLWKGWHKNGKLRSLGHFVKGKRNGLWTDYHANGKKRMATSYDNGRAKGVRKTWDAAGKLVESVTFVNGSRHGKEWSIRSGYKTVTPFRRGREHGTKRVWHKNGKLAQEITYYNGYATGLERHWNDKRVLVLRHRNLTGRRHGLYERWYDNGKIRTRGKYVKGRKVGEWVQYGPGGSVLSRHTY